MTYLKTDADLRRFLKIFTVWRKPKETFWERLCLFFPRLWLRLEDYLTDLPFEERRKRQWKVEDLVEVYWFQLKEKDEHGWNVDIVCYVEKEDNGEIISRKWVIEAEVDMKRPYLRDGYLYRFNSTKNIDTENPDRIKWGICLYVACS